MAEKQEPEEYSATLYRALPELQDPQSMKVATDVEYVLQAVMEMEQVTTDQFQEFLQRLGQRKDSEFLLECKKHFLAWLLRKRKGDNLPEAFFVPLMRIAVYEPNPSFNRGFIEPGLRAFGYRRVQEALLEYLRSGTNREKAGAARAFYWAQLPLLLPQWHDRYANRAWQHRDEHAQAVQEFSYELEKAKQAFQKMCDEELAELRSLIAVAMLKEFIENEDLDVLRPLIPQLSFDPSRYPEAWKQELPRALYIASTHPDEYIRHRAAIQLKGSRSQSFHPENRDTGRA